MSPLLMGRSQFPHLTGVAPVEHVHESPILQGQLLLNI